MPQATGAGRSQAKRTVRIPQSQATGRQGSAGAFSLGAACGGGALGAWHGIPAPGEGEFNPDASFLTEVSAG